MHIASQSAPLASMHFHLVLPNIALSFRDASRPVVIPIASVTMNPLVCMCKHAFVAN